jgi:16S rRNA G527 N7-methylase RsmG
MVESKERKAAFLREVVRSLGLRDADVVPVRFESLGEGHTRAADLVTVRAVRRDAALWSAADLLLRPGGRLVAFGGRGGELSRGFAILERCELSGGGGVLEIATKE